MLIKVLNGIKVSLIYSQKFDVIMFSTYSAEERSRSRTTETGTLVQKFIKTGYMAKIKHELIN